MKLEGNPIGPNPKKKSFKESSWFGEPKCKLVSKVVHFLNIYIFLSLFFKLCENERHAMDCIVNSLIFLPIL
jgi:hypothetical protein